MRRCSRVSRPGGHRDDRDYFEIVYAIVVWSLKEAPHDHHPSPARIRRRVDLEIKRVALSLRVSTEGQVDGHSLDTQLRNWAEREGWEVIEVYLVLKSDRFMRGAGHARVIRDRLASAGVPRFTAEERPAAARIMLEAAGLDLRTGRIEQVLPRPSFEPLFRAVAEIEGGAVGCC